MTPQQSATGARLLIDALAAEGVDTIFCVPGESYLAAIDALYDRREQIRLVVCRHEGSATFMAEAYAKLSGRPGICFVTRAPGATQAAIGVHTAHQDSTPLILFVGQAGRSFMEREAFQEIDYRRMFGPITKWVAQVDDPARVPEMVSRAFHTALSGRRGPVVLALPEDVLSGEVGRDVGVARAVRPTHAVPSAADLGRLLELLGYAERPLAILGGSGWTQAAVDDLGRFLRAAGVPVACSFRRQDLFDNRDPQYVGVLGLGADPALHRAVKEADLLLLLGARMGEVPSSGYTLIESPQPTQVLVHAMPCAEELGRVYRPDLPLLATMPELAQGLAALAVPASIGQRAQAWRETLRQGYERHSAPPAQRDDAVRPATGTVDQAEAWCALRDRLPTDVVITNGAGNYTAWAHRYYRYLSFGSQVAPTSGAMGYGLPAAIGAKLACPQRPVLCLAGDGCFMMSSHELVTAVRLRLPIVIALFDNRMFGTIRMHQERNFPERVYGTDLDNPDFVALARSHGALAQRIESVEALVQAVQAGFEARLPTLLHIPTDPERISPNGSISSIRKSALLKRK
jgi:acetolactate synthase-1/2/3 large subunit